MLQMLRIYAALAVLCAQAIAATTKEKVDQALGQLSLPGVIRSAIGVTRAQTEIPCLLTRESLDSHARKTRVLIIGGLDGSPVSVDAAIQAARWFYGSPGAKRFHNRFALSVVPIANPDGWAAQSGASNLSGGEPGRGYPPQGEAYSSPTNPEAAYLWRWVGMHAPDLVVDVRAGAQDGWLIPESSFPTLQALSKALAPVEVMPASDRLVPQLVAGMPSGVGNIPALEIKLSASGNGFLKNLLPAMIRAEVVGPSPARSEIQRRLRRTPLEVATQLSQRYGHDLDQAVYIPAVALIGRLRLGELTRNPQHLADVERIVAPYFTGAKPSLEKATGSHLPGHLVFGELARLTGKERYQQLARAAADLGFDERGEPRSAMPYHNEMSDSVFMGCAILAQVGRLTGEPRYFDMALRHMKFMLGLNLRPDGLHRHSPLDEAAWGRGNGFPALGLALSLSDIPQNHSARAEMLRAFQAHMKALLPHQDPTGAWRQVIDVQGSYRELTATCMIGFAMLRGVRSGWLERKVYQPRIQQAWHAVRTRVAPDGTLVDVCTGTGKQRSLRDYLDRTAILGADPRGGAMALLFSTEMATAELASPEDQGFRPVRVNRKSRAAKENHGNSVSRHPIRR